MNERPIAAAHDPDLRHALTALRRAAERARELARHTGTALVVSHRGAVQWVRPGVGASNPAPSVQEAPGTYRPEP